MSLKFRHDFSDLAGWSIVNQYHLWFNESAMGHKVSQNGCKVHGVVDLDETLNSRRVL